VLDTVGHLPHADADRVLTEVRGSLPTVSVQAVSDVLRALTDAGLVRRIEPAGHPARYERRVADNHHHIVCRSCGALDDVDCALGSDPASSRAQPADSGSRRPSSPTGGCVLPASGPADRLTVHHDHYLTEKLARFNRVRVPDRVVHAKGGGLSASSRPPRTSARS